MFVSCVGEGFGITADWVVVLNVPTSGCVGTFCVVEGLDESVVIFF